MGLEQRGNGWYYYRKRRMGNRVVSEYVAAGDMALAISVIDKRKKAEAREAKRKAGAFAVDADLEERAKQHFRAVDRMLEEALNQAGFHRPNRGPWRKKRAQENKPDGKEHGT